MSRMLVSGLINIETTVQIDAFPIAYCPVRYPFFGVNSTVSGVGYNVARALTMLGDTVCFQSLIGQDIAGDAVISELKKDNIDGVGVLRVLEKTPQSVILFDREGQRQINVDLKNIQETPYPDDFFDRNIQGAKVAILCNVNFSRPFLKRARKAGIMVASDVHAISRLDDPYNHDFMSMADILFMSHESLPCSPEEWAGELQKAFGTRIVVIGLGKDGALLAGQNIKKMQRVPSILVRPVVNTIGAGDALFSSFVHFFTQGDEPLLALQKATLFASWKIGESGAAQGFLSEAAFARLYRP